MPLRRRPLRRVAVTGAVGAAAYNAGKNKSKSNEASAAAPATPASTAPSTPSAPSDAGGSDPAAEKVEVYEAISKLGDLKEKGLLSDEEFQREKIRLLDL